MGAALKISPGHATSLRLQRRSAPRAMAYLCIDVCTEQDFWTGLTMNISEGGVFVATHVMRPVGSLVGIHLELPHHAARIMTLGEVRWSRDYTGDDDVPPGLGIRFVGLDTGSRLGLRRFVLSLRNEPLRFE